MIFTRTWLFLASAAFALLLPLSSAFAQTSVVEIQRGEEVQVQFDETGATLVLVRGAARLLNGFERMMIGELSGGPPEAMGENYLSMKDSSGQTPPVVPGRLEITFERANEQDHSVLFVRNGYGETLNYRARIWTQGRYVVTDVCQVAPGHYGTEHWPYRIDRIELSDMYTSGWSPGDRAICR